ncbi:SDR family NAD(P)-dependent oxidoreductase [Pedobacter sp. ISL-68]|uniref:SDR family NAD(P)-dependent oxidoreductase n=1 Tax=unclassified Pedobacter TaxID=2628915 RepID=UPI001BEC421C|nr:MULTISPECIES: SDR family NAD(P)-dependent oxidoreductase [unclassified Pedobacter]MBT2560706.1 SDR family NAD(P)-dependent oxidoreductase [Pedobacter sp. ISL-64]MBT2590085.1 SDR family NAD(P)-dependent oxidoreductase [Pedobacter sp. ISL-68]
MIKTIAIFGAGSGLGTSVARRFGREGYSVALIGRRQEPLDELVAELAGQGVDAAAFSADLTNVPAIPELVKAIQARFGHIDVIEYAPISTAPFIPAMELTTAELDSLVKLYVLAPIEIINAVLPNMLARGAGGILIGAGMSAVQGIPYMSGFGPVMAATRNYIYSLHGELADKGVYAGTLTIGASIIGSMGHQRLVSGELKVQLPPGYVVPTVEPDELAEQYWQLFTQRDRAEAIFPIPN